MAATRRIYIGTYSQRGSKGIYHCDMNTQTGALKIVGAANTPNPSFLAFSPRRDLLFACNENEGTATSLHIARDGELTAINTIKTQGSYPCHVSVHPTSAFIAISNYGDGKTTILPFAADGKLGEPTDVVTNQGKNGPNHSRQEGPHAHFATFSPDGRFLYTCDLGLDRVFVYTLNTTSGKLSVVTHVDAVPGSGPRHFAAHPKLPIAAVINEMVSTITVFDHNRQNGTLIAKQTISTLPTDYKGNSTCAEIFYSSDGRFCYGSNRGHDSIAVFSVDSSSGKLTFVTTVPSLGKTPRSFSLIPNTNLLLAAHQDSDNVVAFKIGADGVPHPTGDQITIPASVCVLPFV